MFPCLELRRGDSTERVFTDAVTATLRGLIRPG